ncbi:DUF6339 family protein [Fictibacillus enclensis]|uniref:DUF6339 family protein n=1 Tax=Fictibacillus enclensis TaxID=1017270 RepID=UPI0025A2B643|nr:DUF6339 family protein [Fictibacillus enclensis]MDM5337369.1 DUF6339 family protein [Fictibacillus enclensis]
MRSLRVFKQKSLIDLYNFLKIYEIEKIKVLFEKEEWVEEWFKKYFKDEQWFFESNIPFKKVNLIANTDNDYENAIALYESLPLNKVQATDERLWAYLSLIEYWEYTHKRWKIDSEKDERNRTTILSRYALKIDSGTDRPFMRNSISRLWWVTEMTIDETRKDKYELTRIILSNTDLFQQILERSFSRNEEIIRGILEFLSEIGTEKYMKNRFYRTILKEINALGGVMVLDSLTKEGFKQNIHESINIK